DAHRICLPQPDFLQARARPQDLSGSAAWPCHRSAEPGVGDGHRLRALGARLHLSRRRHGLVQPPGSVVARVDHDGGGILRRGVGGGAGPLCNPQIFNTDQGSEFTCHSFTDVLVEHQIAISMDGRGSWRDNVFLERFWRSVKYEEVYRRAYDSVDELRASLSRRHKLAPMLAPSP